jgi:hypothetical protein
MMVLKINMAPLIVHPAFLRNRNPDSRTHPKKGEFPKLSIPPYRNNATVIPFLKSDSEIELGFDKLIGYVIVKKLGKTFFLKIHPGPGLNFPLFGYQRGYF